MISEVGMCQNTFAAGASGRGPLGSIQQSSRDPDQPDGLMEGWKEVQTDRAESCFVKSPRQNGQKTKLQRKVQLL